MTATRAFISHLHAIWQNGLDQPTLDAAALLVRDGIAVAALGAGQAGPQILVDEAVAAGCLSRCTLIATPYATSASDAARVNGAAMHVLDYEPMWNPANHSVSTTLPALLAIAETASFHDFVPPVTGEMLLRAFSIGIETQARLRRASGQYEPKDLVFHPPGAVGPIGAAVACGVLLNLNVEELTHAACISASRTGSLLVNAGSMTKALHCGQAAASGLESAMLAARGFTADADALFGPRGYGVSLCGHELLVDELMAQLAQAHIVDPGPAFKFYPSQYGTHFIITAALAARAQLRPGEAVATVHIISPDMAYVHRPWPASGLAGKFSFQYTAAAALLDGQVNVASFSDERRFSEDMERLLAATTITTDPAREGRFDRMTLDIEIVTSSGRMVRATCDGPPGIWGKSAAASLVDAKARDCLNTVYGEAKADQLLFEMARIPNMGAFDLKMLMRLTRLG